ASVEWSNSVILTSGAASGPSWIGSNVIGPPGVGAVCAEARSGTRTTASSRTKCLTLIGGPQAHVERCRLAAVDVDVGDVGAISLLLNFDGVSSFGDFNHHAALRIRTVPRLSVDQDFSAGGLHANRERAVAGRRLDAHRSRRRSGFRSARRKASR